MKAIARIFVTNLQLLDDARQRHTMTTTFLALMQDPKNQMTIEDRVLILQALFRLPGADVEDEVPTNWIEVLLKRADSSK